MVRLSHFRTWALRWPFVFAALVVAATPIVTQANEKEAKAPNVLFIAVDDLNDWIGCLGGHPQARTPNIDRLAKQGVLFTRAYCSAPACNPSRASLLTGVRPSNSGVYHNNQDWRPPLQGAVTLPRHFRLNGYLVWGGGKIFHGGFNDAQAWDDQFKGKGKLPAKKTTQRGIGGNMMWGPIDAGDEVMPDTHLTDWAIGKLKEKHAKPFFLAVGFAKPHLVWHAPKKYFDMHPLDKVQLPKVLDNDLDDVPPAGVKMAKPDGDHRQVTKAGQWKEAVQAYLACCTYVDHQLGRLLHALAESEYADNTIIIFWGDHGWHHGQKEHWRKFALWEQAVRVPFIVVAPGHTRPAQRCERTVTLMDIYPTLIDLCGLPKRKLEANSLLPLLKEPTSKWEHPALTTHGRNNHSVRTERWRYIRYANGDEELYDHSSDPLEWKNLAKAPEAAQVKAELARHLPKVNVPDADKAKGQGKGKKKDKNKKADTSVSGETSRADAAAGRSRWDRASFCPMAAHGTLRTTPWPGPAASD